MALSAREVALQRLARGASGPMDLIPPEEELGAYIADRPAYDQPLSRPAAFSVEDGEIVQMDAQAGDRARAAGRETFPEAELGARRAALEGLASGNMVPTVNPETGELESMPEAEARAAGRIIVPRDDATSAFSTRQVSGRISGDEDRDLYAGTRLLPNDPRLASPTAAPAAPRTARPPPPVAERTLRASVPEPTQLPVPMDAPAVAAPAARKAPAPDEFAAAQDAARQRRLSAGLGQAADFIGASIAGTRPQTGFYENLGREADLPVRDYLAARQQRAGEARSAEEAALKDPGSEQSKRFQAFVARTFSGVYTPEDVALMAAADAPMVTKMGEMRAALNARKEEQAARATADTTESEAQRTFQAEESQKQRALQRELAQMRQGDPTAKADERVQKMESGLRKEFEGNQVVKDYRGATTSFRKVQNAAATPGAAGSLALTFAVMKTLDPTSVVKESEKATVENARGVPESIRATWNRVLAGDNLTEAQRAELVNMAAGQYRAYEDSYNDLANRYAGLATAAGATPGRVSIPTAPLRAPMPTDATGRMELAPGKVQMRAPNGSIGMVDAAEAEEAERNGYARI